MQNLSVPQKVLALILIILVVAPLFIGFALNAVLENDLEKTASTTIGTQARIERFNLNPLRGRLDIDEFSLDNPEGFTTPYALKIQQIELLIKPSTIFTETLEIEKFEIQQLDVNVEQRLLKNNLLTIKEGIESGKNEKETEETPPDPNKKKLKLLFDYLGINNLSIALTVSPLVAKGETLTLQIPDLKLTNFSSDELTVPEFIKRVIAEIVINVLKKGEGNVPPDY